MQNAKHLLRLTGLGFFLIFCLFFFLGTINEPLFFELKKVDLSVFKESTIQPHSYQKESKKKSLRKKTITGVRDSVKIDSSSVQGTITNNLSQVASASDSNQRVLLIGDSQLEGLRGPVSAYCEKNNHTLLSTIIWYSSSTKQWATTDTLEYYLDMYKPTVVLFAIGLNELFVRDLDTRAEYMKTILKVLEAHGVRYSWIGPAAWTKDNGIIEVMKKVVGDHFYPSHLIKMERASDGRHPSKGAAKLWFDQVAISLTDKGVINFKNKVDVLGKLKFSKTILLRLK